MSLSVVYQTASGAESAAIRQLRASAPDATIARAPLFQRVWRVQRGDGLQVVPLEGGWGLVAVPAEELNERVRHAAVDDCLKRANAARARAAELFGSNLAVRHQEEAQRLELRAAALLDDSEPLFSAERDQRPQEVA